MFPSDDDAIAFVNQIDFLRGQIHSGKVTLAVGTAQPTPRRLNFLLPIGIGRDNLLKHSQHTAKSYLSLKERSLKAECVL